MRCWQRGGERSTGCDAAGGAASGQAMPDDGTRQLLRAGIWILVVGAVAALLTDHRFRRHWRARSPYELRLAFLDTGLDVPALWKHADAVGNGQMAAQSTPCPPAALKALRLSHLQQRITAAQFCYASAYLLQFRNWLDRTRISLYVVGTTELHATFREESRTSLFSASAALQEIRGAIGLFVVFSQGKPHLASIIRPQ